MKIIEASGVPRTIPPHTGEALREEIRQHLAFPAGIVRADRKRRTSVLLSALERNLPDMLSDVVEKAEGAADARGEKIQKGSPPLFGNLATHR
ncbi:MAG: hypothetical protein V1800_14115 [Candidatus Latescibacterota bacterium]